MLRLMPILVAFPMLLAFGAMEGAWTERWQHSHLTDDAAGRLAQVPLSVGEWQSQTQELDQRASVKAELSGSQLRHYTHRTSGALLTVLFVCGRPGPISVHTPDVCFVGSGYALADTPSAHAIPEMHPAQFVVGKFRKGDDAISEYFRAFWGWSADGDWSAPPSPRLAFARVPVLYKLYVIRSLVRADEPLANDPAQDFLRLFLPQFREYVFSNSTGKDISRSKP
jgi:hypothetical protein